ncbi:MAG: ribosome-associated translation inhibitor RaiA [Methylococcus sp.]|jgi:putative sigma-54 modulation protein|nr:MAG: ribosome-associated translation inhibitor RaiA [Methylococcus sp.]
MHIDITGHHIQVTEALKNHIHEKFTRIERHFEQAMKIHVVLEVEKHGQKAEATIQVKGETLFAEDTQDDLYAAIDALVDKLDRQLIKYKEKHQSH